MSVITAQSQMVDLQTPMFGFQDLMCCFQPTLPLLGIVQCGNFSLLDREDTMNIPRVGNWVQNAPHRLLDAALCVYNPFTGIWTDFQEEAVGVKIESGVEYTPSAVGNGFYELRNEYNQPAYWTNHLGTNIYLFEGGDRVPSNDDICRRNAKAVLFTLNFSHQSNPEGKVFFRCAPKR
jgi:hypothetical protein